jgi:hypothetical protein
MFLRCLMAMAFPVAIGQLTTEPVRVRLRTARSKRPSVPHRADLEHDDTGWLCTRRRHFG